MERRVNGKWSRKVTDSWALRQIVHTGQASTYKRPGGKVGVRRCPYLDNAYVCRACVCRAGWGRDTPRGAQGSSLLVVLLGLKPPSFACKASNIPAVLLFQPPPHKKSNNFTQSHLHSSQLIFLFKPNTVWDPDHWLYSNQFSDEHEPMKCTICTVSLIMWCLQVCMWVTKNYNPELEKMLSPYSSKFKHVTPLSNYTMARSNAVGKCLCDMQ